MNAGDGRPVRNLPQDFDGRPFADFTLCSASDIPDPRAISTSAAHLQTRSQANAACSARTKRVPRPLSTDAAIDALIGP
jgi:hypothetical protein